MEMRVVVNGLSFVNHCWASITTTLIDHFSNLKHKAFDIY